MDKYEQAIAYFEDAIKESDEIIADCSPDLQAELAEQKGYFVVALEALKSRLPQNGWTKIHIKNQLNNAATVEFCIGEKEFKLGHDETATVQVNDEDCLYLDIVKNAD